MLNKYVCQNDCIDSFEHVMTIWREMLLSDDWYYNYYLLFIDKFILLMTCWINIVISFEYEKNKSYCKLNCISNSLSKIFNAIIAAIYSFITSLDVRCIKMYQTVFNTDNLLCRHSTWGTQVLFTLWPPYVTIIDVIGKYYL